jgi:hypothetical protein
VRGATSDGRPYRDRLLAYVTGTVNQELLLQNEYLAPENRILRAKLPSRLRLSDPERAPPWHSINDRPFELARSRLRVARQLPVQSDPHPAFKTRQSPTDSPDEAKK